MTTKTVIASEPAERGAATIIIELSKGVITVKHGASPGNPVLQQWVANPGDWDRLWKTIMSLQLAGGQL